jgi:zinc transport system ATP-binding protein
VHHPSYGDPHTHHHHADGTPTSRHDHAPHLDLPVDRR